MVVVALAPVIKIIGDILSKVLGWLAPVIDVLLKPALFILKFITGAINALLFVVFRGSFYSYLRSQHCNCANVQHATEILLPRWLQPDFFQAPRRK
jgi:hypothetical protein